VGWSYFYGRKWDEAVAAFSKAVELEPKLAADANNGIAWAYFFKGDLAQAEASRPRPRTAGRNDTKLATNIENKKKGMPPPRRDPTPATSPPRPGWPRVPTPGR
jgi:Flp pilus assembly protein TadD